MIWIAAAAIVFFAVTPIVIFLSYFLILKRMVKIKSKQIRRLRDELLGLGQVREHWKTLAEELSSLDEAGQRDWLHKMRADSGL